MNRCRGDLARVLTAFALAAVAGVFPACAQVAGEPAAVAKSPEPTCPTGSGWDGAHCVRTLVVTEVACPAGSTWDGTRCAGQVIASCPAGTRFVQGTGCVAEPTPGTQAAANPTLAPAAASATPTTPGPSTTVSRATPASPPMCGCSSGDLMCLMKCSALCKDNPGISCTAQVPRTPAGQSPTPPANREFDRNAASTALTAAATAARGCTGVSGSASVRVVFAPSGRVSSASLQGGPFAGTPQGGCIASSFRSASVPAFDGADVSVSKSVVIP